VKIIISRKGSDSGKDSGGMASPILPCGCLCSIPIPYKRGVPYSDIRFGKHSLDQICRELDSGWKRGFAHLDPDLRFESFARGKRPKDWRPAFGQSGASASHLNNQGVGKGDLFVFFGWFRTTEVIGNKLRFRSDDKGGRHIIYGWLQVEEVFSVDGRELPNHLQFLREHAHMKFVEEKRNLIYIGTEAGAGVFAKAHDGLVLTKPGCKRSIWELPSVFQSVYRQPTLTYHKNKEKRWFLDDGQICLKTVGRGQEFVLDCEKHPRVRDYFLKLIRSVPKEPVLCSHEIPCRRMILGSAKGEFTVPDGFNDPLPKEIEDLFWK